jgi:soluble lytic murein transglycosylase
LIEQALAVRSEDPGRAIELLVEADVGAVLERTRLEVWLEILDRHGSDSTAWRQFLASAPPPDLAIRGSLGLARALVDRGEHEAAAEVLENVPPAGRGQADALLVEMADGPWREPAARRLAVAAPATLRRVAPDLDRQVPATLSADELLDRGMRWQEGGRPERTVAELRPKRWRGPDERRRRLVLARAEVAVGSPTRALRLLPSAAQADGEQLMVRGQAFRRRAWQRAPDPNARSAFADCLSVANRALTVSGTARPVRLEALQLVLECGTEAGALEEALDAWWALEANGWRNDQRDWLGRRLGVALAQREGNDPRVHDLASSLPRHNRCLRFWAWLNDQDGREELRRLAEAPLADIYGVWARKLLGIAEPERLQLPAPVEPGDPPWSVQWLMDRDAISEASSEWRRIPNGWSSTRSEMLAAVGLSTSLSRHHQAIRWLVSAFPGVGTVKMDREPENAVQAYLPLRWAPAIRAAANESGVEPWLVAGVARQESLFGEHARSPRGALGVLQLRPDTARMHARALGLGTSPDLYDPEINIRIGTRELARLIRRFESVEPALAAYNAGETRARRWQRRWQDRRRFTEAIPIPESYNYVRRVVYLAEAYRLVYDDVWRRPP